jgi:hypothetical protein
VRQSLEDGPINIPDVPEHNTPKLKREASGCSLMSDRGGLSKGLKIKPLEVALDIFKKKHDNEEVLRLKKRFLMGFHKFLREFTNHVEYVTHIFNLFKADVDDRTIKKK